MTRLDATLTPGMASKNSAQKSSSTLPRSGACAKREYSTARRDVIGLRVGWVVTAGSVHALLDFGVQSRSLRTFDPPSPQANHGRCTQAGSLPSTAVVAAHRFRCEQRLE